MPGGWGMVRAGAQEGGAPEGLLFHVPLPAPSPPGSCPTRKVTVAFLLVGPSAAGDTTVAMGTTPGYFVLRWEKNCLLLSSGPAKGPTFYNRWKLFPLFPGVRVGRAGISLESWGPQDSRPSSGTHLLRDEAALQWPHLWNWGHSSLPA